MIFSGQNCSVFLCRPVNNFCRPVSKILCYWGGIVFYYAKSYERIHTTLEMLLLLQTKVTKLLSPDAFSGL